MSRSTSRQSIPAIASENLRDHADRARVDRVWERLERNLPPAGSGQSRERKPLRWLALSAAIVAGFVLGMSADRWLADGPEHTAGVVPQLSPASDGSPQQVFAAGQTQREYPLPGGGSLRLAPGTIVDTVTSDGRGLTLRLVRGEASMSTQAVGAAARTTPLALLVGDAQVSTGRGDLRVTRSGDTAKLEVLGGSARVASPDVELGMRQTTLGPNDRLTVPIRIATAALTTPSDQYAPHSALQVEEEGPEEEVQETPIETPAGWREQCRDAEYGKALELLRSETGGGPAAVAAASSAADLMCVGDAFAFRGGDAAVAQLALTRIVNEFPQSGYLAPALFRLGKMYERAGDLDRAGAYYERLRSLSPDGVLADDALCRLIQAAAQRGNGEALVRLAQKYRTQYPDGACIDEDIEQQLAEIAAKQGSGSDQGSGASESDPEADEPSAEESGDEGPAGHGSAGQPEQPAKKPPAADASGDE